jgi:hypothetical protein
MSTTKKHDAGAAEGARGATEQSPESAGAAGAGQWASRRKVSVIVELLRGADLESTSRKYRVTVATLADWRDRFLASGEAGVLLKMAGLGKMDRSELTLNHLISRLKVRFLPSSPLQATSAKQDHGHVSSTHPLNLKTQAVTGFPGRAFSGFQH